MDDARPLRICLFGAPDDTGNLGVSALLGSALGGIAEFSPGAEVTVFDNGFGVRSAERRFASGRFAYRLCGARLSRRWHRPESYFHMRLSRRLGGRFNPGMRAILEADAVWDVSGGDSFADLYGDKVLAMMLAPKELALDCGKPLLLLPQTYGPFQGDLAREQARTIIAGATQAWARDAESFGNLRDLAGSNFDPERHREGVDLAFRLEARDPEPLPTWWTEAGSERVGINISGLVYNDPDSARRFGHRAVYRELVHGLVTRLLERSDARVLLIPHVQVPTGRMESDADACRGVLEHLGSKADGRVSLLKEGLDASETKGILARCSWFSGTRMHACIGALSSAVPTAGLAYSLKTQGVFETCGQGDHVADLRSLSTEDALELIWRSFEGRETARTTLAEALPAVKARASEELSLLVEATRRAAKANVG